MYARRSAVSSAKVQCGWVLVGPGCWQRGQEVICRRAPGVWFWHPDGLEGKRRIGPFMTMKGARLRSLRGIGHRARDSENGQIVTETSLHRQ
jgi:hypothetical protein